MSAREFDCTECGRHIVRLMMRDDEVALCAECLVMPGWFENPKLRRMLDPGWGMDVILGRKPTRKGERDDGFGRG